jgi:protein SEY1
MFSETKALKLGARLRCEADIHYVEAKQSTVASIAQIRLLVMLRWHEAMMILFNPLYFTMMLILASGS